MNIRPRTIIIIASIVFSLLIIGSLFFVWQQSQMGRVILTTFPNDATVTIDGKTIATNGASVIQPGNHTIKASRNLFKDQTQTFTIAKGENKNISFYLKSDGDAGLQWLQDHPDQAAAIEGHYSQEYEQQTNALYNDNQIIQQLPVIDNTYRIDYGSSKRTPPGQFALYIQASDQSGRNDALDWMKTNGFDPTKYEIIYVDPLTQVQTPGN